MASIRIGELARRAEVNLQTIRYYERRGLLPEPPRTAGNYRVYSPDDVLRVRFIRRAQELGFSLDEIGELLSLRLDANSRCGDVRTRAAAKLRDLDDRIDSLQSMRAALASLVAECPSDAPVKQCPILQTLDATEAPCRRSS